MTLTYAIKEGFAYERREASGVQSPRHTLDRRRGSCRDFAVLMMEAARALGIAARFVSGYVFVPSEEGEPVRLGGGATHAWCQIYLPGAGWVEFDPTNGLVGGKDLIRVAVARDPAQAAPLTGAYFGNADDDMGHGSLRRGDATKARRARYPRGPIAAIARDFRHDHPRRIFDRVRVLRRDPDDPAPQYPSVARPRSHVARRRANDAALTDRRLSRSVRQSGDAGRGASRRDHLPQ